MECEKSGKKQNILSMQFALIKFKYHLDKSVDFINVNLICTKF